LTKAISARALRKVYPGTPPVEALGGVDIDIADNEFFTLLGPSGCGKTTILRLIAGFEHPTSGSLDMFGQSLLDLPPYKRQINTVFQSYALFPHMSVAENIGFGLEMLGKPKSEIKSTVAEMMDLVQMSHLADRQTSQISGGQQQRVGSGAQTPGAAAGRATERAGFQAAQKHAAGAEEASDRNRHHLHLCHP